MLVKMSQESPDDEIFYKVPDPYAGLHIPDSWENVTEFGLWWMNAGMPTMFPLNAEVYQSDDATSTALFRKGRFQVELYLIHPKQIVPDHEHPGVEVISMRVGYKKHYSFSDVLRAGVTHGVGGVIEEHTGYPIVTFQHWLTREPCTVAAMWKGPTVGPLQEALIKKYNPNAYVVNGYADISIDIGT